MILSTHAIVGGAIASLMPDQPALAFVAGIASHFIIDAIPHSDYPLRSLSISRNRPTLFADRLWVRDLGLLVFDASAGLAIALLLYASPQATPAILLGAVGGMVPDPLRLIHRLYPWGLFAHANVFMPGYTQSTSLPGRGPSARKLCL